MYMYVFCLFCRASIICTIVSVCLFCLLKLTWTFLFCLLAIQLHGQVVGLRDVGVVRGFRGAGVVPVWPIVGRLLPQKSRLPPVREALRHPPQEVWESMQN